MLKYEIETKQSIKKRMKKNSSQPELICQTRDLIHKMRITSLKQTETNHEV
jgi:hypothetical protein